MKFINLLKKELRELINAQMIISLAVIVVIFMVFGSVMSTTISEASKQEYSVSLSDQDDTDFTRSMIQTLRDNGAKVTLYETSPEEDYSAMLSSNDISDLIIIPEGFTAALDSGEKPELVTVSSMESAAMMDNFSDGTSSGVSLIEQCISGELSHRAGVSDETLEYIGSPLTVTENTVVGSRSARISPDTVMGRIMLQNEFLPIIIFVLIMMTSQTLMGAISNEKIDKTLETLLSAPVSRISILTSKMLAATIVALLNAAVCMFSFTAFMAGSASQLSETGVFSETGVLPEAVSSQAAITKLGLSLSMYDYLLVGVELFVTIMICLCISLILGALVSDTKQSQTMLLPLMMAAMIPYFISLFADINGLPIAIRVIVYAIPFTHTFSAIPNLMFGHTGIFLFGLIYQVVFLAVCLFFALRIFNSDKILTISLNLGQKSKFRKKKSQAG